MVTILLSILKIAGIVLLCLFLLALCLLLLVLFVPVRYQVKGYKKDNAEISISVSAEATWLLRFVRVTFCYPKETYIKVKALFFTVFSTQKEEGRGNGGKSRKKGKNEKHLKTALEKSGQSTDAERKSKAANKEAEQQKTAVGKEAEQKKEAPNGETGQKVATASKETKQKDETASQQAEQNSEAANEGAEQQKTSIDKEAEQKKEAPNKEASNKKNGKLIVFLRKLLDILKNIHYTIRQIYDKIKHVIKNIRYYIQIVESDSFQKAWSLCSREVFLLIKSILPKKINGTLLIGTGNPESTAKILSVQGILYPLIGERIKITPDFDNAIMEGSFSIKGKVTAFKILKTAMKVYFNKDLKKVIRMFKKEAA